MACPGAVPFMGRSLDEIEVLDAQAEGFHETEAAAIHELGGEFPRICEVGENRADFLAGHDDRRAALAAGKRDVVEGEFLDTEDVSHQECHGIERLLLGSRGDVALEGEVVEIIGNAGGDGVFRSLSEFDETKTGEADGPSLVDGSCRSGATGLKIVSPACS